MRSEAVLLLVQSDPIGVDGEDRWIDRKTLSGLRAFVEEWPGRVVVSAPSMPGTAGVLHERVPAHELAFDLILDTEPRAAANSVDPAVVLALHSPANYALIDWDPMRVVYTVENGLRQRLRVELIQSRGVISRARIVAGLARRMPAFRGAIRKAGGIQCNGYASWEAHRHLNRAPLLFFDHRVPAHEIERSRPVEPSPTGPLRLGYSGRHIPIKGPQYAVALIDVLRSRGVESTLTVYGDGEMRSVLEQSAGEEVAFLGALPFQDEWIPSVRDGIDLMVLPYPQADPAGTYLETFALGVPVLGFAHEAFSPFAEDHGAGWQVEIGRVDALADTVEMLSANRRLLTGAGRSALDFMGTHSAEAEFTSRVEHLRRVAQV